MHRRLQIRKQAPQSRRRSSAQGLRRLLCAGDAENANQPGFSVEPTFRGQCLNTISAIKRAVFVAKPCQKGSADRNEGVFVAVE